MSDAPRPVINSHETESYTATCPGCDQDATWVSSRRQWSDSGHDWPPLIFIDCPRCGMGTEPVFPQREFDYEAQGEVLIG